MDDYKAIESGKDYLAHHGVKGMKWGIRHDPVPSGRSKSAKKLGDSIESTTRKIAKKLKKASKASYKAAKRARGRALQRKIEKAIASGNSTRINKLFSKMNDVQAARAVNRVNQRETILRAKAEDGRRSLKNINMQRKIDSLNLRNQYRRAKHPNLYTAKDNAVNNGSKIISTKLATEMSNTLISAVKKAVDNPEKASEKAEKEIDEIAQSDFMDRGKDYLAHHGVKGMKWGIRHDQDRVESLRSKNTKLEGKLALKKLKKKKFDNSWRGTTARKADIRLARQKKLGLIGSHYLAKSKKLDFKIAKVEKKIYNNDKKINDIITNANRQMKLTKKEKDYHYGLVRMSKRMPGELIVTKRDSFGRPSEFTNVSKDYDPFNGKKLKLR